MEGEAIKDKMLRDVKLGHSPIFGSKRQLAFKKKLCVHFKDAVYLMTFYLLDTRFILFSGFPSNIFCLEKDIFSLSCFNFLSTDFCTL